MIDTRRQFIAAIGALGAAALVPGCAAVREARERRLVDTHHHFYAPEYQKAWLDWEDQRKIPHFQSQVSWSVPKARRYAWSGRMAPARQR